LYRHSMMICQALVGGSIGAVTRPIAAALIPAAESLVCEAAEFPSSARRATDNSAPIYQWVRWPRQFSPPGTKEAPGCSTFGSIPMEC
jgi:hypothetical protein